MEEETNIYFKQQKLFDPEKEQPTIHVYGAGSIGSHVTIGLAKIGMKEIKVYDYDELEIENTPAQFYPQYKYTKEKKLDELFKITNFMTNTRITLVEGKITEETELEITMNSIHIIAFDNIEGRKVIYEKLKGYPVHLIDGRIGSYNMEKYYLKMDEEEHQKEYEKTLKGEFSELECGEKCLWAINSMIASKIIADTIKITKKEKPNYMHKANLMSDISINKR